MNFAEWKNPIPKATYGKIQSYNIFEIIFFKIEDRLMIFNGQDEMRRGERSEHYRKRTT